MIGKLCILYYNLNLYNTMILFNNIELKAGFGILWSNTISSLVTNNGEIRNRLDIHIISYYSDADSCIMTH